MLNIKTVGFMVVALIYAAIAFFGAMGLGYLALTIARMSISIGGGYLDFFDAILFVGSAVIGLVAGKGYLDSRDLSE